MLTRRQFLRAAAAVGVSAAVPSALGSFLQAARAASPATAYFLTPDRWATCAALCARIVPTGSNPATDPGATEADAVVFIDRFLSAFELPASIADNPAIWVTGQWSGRNPFAEDGEPGGDYPADAFLDTRGVAHFLPLTPVQAISWRVQLYGSSALSGLPPYAASWAKQVGSLIPATTGLRDIYNVGLDAFDTWSKQLFGVPFASASSEEQDVMVSAAGNVVLSAVTTNLPSTGAPTPPPAASTLFPIITLHTFQATYGLPEYAWRNQNTDPSIQRLEGTSQWRALAYDGDTQPLGSSIYDSTLAGAGEGPNAGFGEPGVYVPAGDYREFRPVSTLDPEAVPLNPAQEVWLGNVISVLRRKS